MLIYIMYNYILFHQQYVESRLKTSETKDMLA